MLNMFRVIIWVPLIIIPDSNCLVFFLFQIIVCFISILNQTCLNLRKFLEKKPLTHVSKTKHEINQIQTELLVQPYKQYTKIKVDGHFLNKYIFKTVLTSFLDFFNTS